APTASDAGRRARCRSRSRAARAATGARRTAPSSPTSSPRPPRCPPGADQARVLPVFTADEMRRVDQRAIRELGIPGATLMENAGRGAAARIVEVLPDLGLPRRGARVAIVCGKGGNGGDGFVVARWLKRSGQRVDVFVLARADELRGDPATMLAQARQRGIRPRIVEDSQVLARGLVGGALVVHAILGTGARGEPAPLHARAIEAINASGRPVVALDVPSGLPADGGPPLGPAVRAALA